jgi:hypothetical protein
MMSEKEQRTKDESWMDPGRERGCQTGFMYGTKKREEGEGRYGLVKPNAP